MLRGTVSSKREIEKVLILCRIIDPKEIREKILQSIVSTLK